MDRLDPFHLRHAEIGHTAVAYFPFLNQFGNRFPRFLDILVRHRPVDLVEVDHVDIQAAQALLRLFFHTPLLEPIVHLPVAGILPDQAALSGNDDLLPATFDRLAHDLLRVAQPVSGSGVDPVDAQVQGAPDHRQRLLVILLTPPKLPRPAYRPRTQADCRQVEVALS